MSATSLEEAVELDVDLTIEPVCEKTTKLGFHRDADPPEPCTRPAAWMSVAGCGARALACEAHYARFLTRDWESKCVRCFDCLVYLGPHHWTWTRL